PLRTSANQRGTTAFLRSAKKELPPCARTCRETGRNRAKPYSFHPACPTQSLPDPAAGTIHSNPPLGSAEVAWECTHETIHHPLDGYLNSFQSFVSYPLRK